MSRGPRSVRFTTPAYGGDWNPEQWFADADADAILDEDIAKMREAGVTLVTLGVFSWSRLEPEEGRYELDWLEGILDRLHAAGIGVDLATGTASPPVWMALNHPESLPVDARGVRLGFGSRQQYSPNSSAYRTAALALVDRLAERFGDHPALVLWHVGNEFACHVRECFSEESKEAFRAWLEARYSSIEALNRAWGTDFWSQRYTSFAQVSPPSAMPSFPNPSQVLDWRRFTDDSFRSLFEAEAAVIRAHSTRPITTNFMGAFPVLDYRKWAKCVDVVADDSYPDPADPLAAHEIAFAGDLMRGLGGGAPWILMEQAPGAIQWRPRNSPKRPGQFLLWSLARLAHGADAVLQFQWRQSRAGAETFHSGMIPHAGAVSRTWDEVVETGRALSRLGPVVGARTEAGIAIVVDWESEWARAASIGPTEEPAEPLFALARHWHRTAWEAGYQVDLVGPEADLSGYSLVIVPGVFIDRPALTDALAAAAQGGAQVLVVGPSGVVDESAHAILGGYLGSARGLLGVAVADHAALTGPVRGDFDSPSGPASAVSRITRAVGAPAACTSIGLRICSEDLADRLSALAGPDARARCGMWAEELVGYGRSDAGAENGGCGDAGGAAAGVATDEGGAEGLGEGAAGGLDEDTAGLMGEDDAGSEARAFERGRGLPPDVDAVAVFDESEGGADLAGMPALTRRMLASGGAAWYLACHPDDVTARALFDLLAGRAGIAPVVADLPDGVEASRRGDFLFLLNHSDASVRVRGVKGSELLSGSAVEDGIEVGPRSGVVVALSA